MPKSTKEEKYRWIKPIIDGDISIKAMAKVCPFSTRSIKYWLKTYRQLGIPGLENKSTKPKSQPNETPIRIKEHVIELRKKTNKCALKLKWDLNKRGINIHQRTIGKIIKQEGLTRKYRIKRVKYKYIKALLKPGELIEIDVKYVPKIIDNKQFFQYTAIDVATRWRFLQIYDSQSSYNAIKFLQEIMKRFPKTIQAIKTDNHATFTNRYTGYLKSEDPFNPKLHALDQFCIENDMEHYLIDPGKPAQNGTVERSHRSDQETFYDKVKYKSIKELKLKINLWNLYYNDLEHCGLDGLTPNNALKLKVQNVRS